MTSLHFAGRRCAGICGYMRWRSLLFLHWPVPAGALGRLLPPGLEVDLFDGSAFVGLVAFAMEGVRPVLVPRLLSLRCLEANVRTYVKGPGGAPGVYFFSLDASSLLAVLGARLTFHLPYHHAAMEMSGESIIDYTVRRRGGTAPRLRLRYRPCEPLPSARPGTREHFLIERYTLFVERRGALFSSRMRHEPYPLRAAEVIELEDELVPACGLPPLEGPPFAAHWSPGVDVRAEWLQRARGPGTAGR